MFILPGYYIFRLWFQLRLRDNTKRSEQIQPQMRNTSRSNRRLD
jgi:hypothetical protein